MARATNCIGYYEGGIHGRKELAIRDDGALFERFQDKTIYGYRWSAWRATGEVLGHNERANPEQFRSAGFSTMSLRRPGEAYYINKRLPKAA